ncbi:MAG: DUF262 domain-containing protein [Planctomycetota bacterium]|nr:DUF262 domain-containing protein [Planctomycetota bacterium]
MARKTAASAGVSRSRDDEVEGLDSTEDDGLGEYPIDTLLIRTETRTVFDVVRRIRGGGFVMNPDFQRDFVWPPEKQSKLIESVLMRIPLPVFYLAENKKGQTVVVDGLQRLSTFESFLGDKVSLHLPEQESLHRRKFTNLSEKLQNRIEDCQLVLYIIDSKVPERAKLDIFERVNSGEPLTRQQMRNCLYMGPATNWLKTEAKTDLFVRATGESLDAGKMRDREFVNRFCAFRLVGFNEYRKDMDAFLARSLELMNELSEEQLNDLSRQFRLALENNFALFDRHAFRKHQPHQSELNPINASLWDVMTTGLARYPTNVVSRKADNFRERFFTLLDDEEFNSAITYSPNSTKCVRRRFELGETLFREVFGDYPG